MRYEKNILTSEIYCELRKSVEWFELPKIKIEEAIKNSKYTITVFDCDNPVGMGRLIGDGIYFAIVDVVVKPEYQRKGIGTQIVNMFIDYVDKETIAGSRSSIQLIAEKGKEGFYEKLGFKKIPNEFCGSGMRKVIRK